MFTITPDAPASTPSPAHATADNKSTPLTHPQAAPPQLPTNEFADRNIRHMLFGTPEAVQQTVQTLHSRGYAEPNDWSPALSTGRPGEVMKILIKRLSPDS